MLHKEFTYYVYDVILINKQTTGKSDRKTDIKMIYN